MIMKRNIQIISAVLLLTATIISCEKVPQGFLSDQIRYRDNPIQVQRGIVAQTNPVDNDGSSAPVTYELLDIRNATTHKHADSLYMNSERYVWTGKFDPVNDTTVELLNTRRELVNAPCFEFNPNTGAFTFYGTTAKVPLGTYEFDVRATNENGSKDFKNIATFTLFEADAFEVKAGGGAWFKDNTDQSGDIGAPEVKIQKLSTEGASVILKIVDKNGVAWNPKNNEILKRGDRNSFETFARFHPLVLSDTSMTCNFEVIPFPLIQGPQGYLIYYRIPGKFARVDPGLTPTPDRGYSVNPRFEFHIYQEGTYLVTVRLKNVTRDVL